MAGIYEICGVDQINASILVLVCDSDDFSTVERSHPTQKGSRQVKCAFVRISVGFRATVALLALIKSCGERIIPTWVQIEL